MTPYIHSQLTKVSRSFALAIPCLEKPLDQMVGISYLVFRVLDNIEDCSYSLAQKKSLYLQFSELFKGISKSEKVLQNWSKLDWPGLNQDEKNIMGSENGLELWSSYYQRPEFDQKLLKKFAGQMAKGMIKMDPLSSGKALGSKNLRQFNLYCYYVAGIVGNLLTELIIHYYKLHEDLQKTLRKKAKNFGLGLQKTNIIKDFKSDFERKVCFLPQNWLVSNNGDALKDSKTLKLYCLKNLKKELQIAGDYTLLIPENISSYRSFCLIALIPALETLKKACTNFEKLFSNEHFIKIDRKTMAFCLEQARLASASNTHLEALLNSYWDYFKDEKWLSPKS